MARDRSRDKPRVNKRDALLFMVYIIEAGEYVKVGIAEDVVKRLRVFRSHSPTPVSLAYCSKPVIRPEARRIELACHAILMRDHAHGEWFKVGKDVAILVLAGLIDEAVERPVPTQLKLVS